MDKIYYYNKNNILMSTMNFDQNKAPAISIGGALFYIIASKFYF